MRFIRKCNPLAPINTLLIHINFSNNLWQIFCQQSGERCTRKRSKLWNHGAGTSRVFASWNHRLNIDCKHITLLRTFNHDRSVLRVDKGHPKNLGGKIFFSLDLTFKGIPRLNNHPIPRSDPEHLA
ncbi:MAG: hypothetical protein EB017_12940 [Betaproteobacteria bacterium]|nr:hypothetical protein [Betaproteobacteria bacterium]